MKEFVIFHKKIEDIFNNNTENFLNPRTYLLLSIDEINVYWLIKLDSNDLFDEILNNFKFILPSGVKIIGVLKLGKIDDKEFHMITTESFRKIKNLCKEYELDIISRNFYSIVISMLDHNSKSNSCIGLIYNQREGEENNLILVDNFNKIKYEDLEEKVHSEFFIVNSFINPLMIINKEKVIINKSYFSSNVGLIFRNLNIILHKASFYFHNKNTNDKFQYEKEALINKYKSKLENFMNCKVKKEFIFRIEKIMN